MQLAVSMLAGLIVGVVLFLLTRKRPGVAMWTAIVLGVIGSVLFLGTINGLFLPEMGRLGAVGLGLLSGVATALAVGCLLRGERRPLNWVAVAVSAPPVLFLVVFGIAEVLGPSH
jgi:uncharacterized membrane protein YeaQ/YmgE (transglycosylase-associated protein family)